MSNKEVNIHDIYKHKILEEAFHHCQCTHKHQGVGSRCSVGVNKNSHFIADSSAQYFNESNVIVLCTPCFRKHSKQLILPSLPEGIIDRDEKNI